MVDNNTAARPQIAAPEGRQSLESLRAENQTIQDRLPAISAMAAEAKARKQAEQAAGTNATGTGKQQQAQGQAQVGMGTGLGITGGVTTYMGTTKQALGDTKVAAGQAMNISAATTFGATALPGATLVATGMALKATGTAMTTIGTGMISSGLTMMATGVVSLASANENIQKGTSHLAKAVQEGIISKEQGSIANKEMIRSQIFETKIEMLEGTMLELESTGKLQGEDAEALSQEEIDKIKNGGKAMYDTAFNNAADGLANNGIMSLQDGDNTRYFMEGANGNPSEINVLTGEDGQPQLDTAGRLQLDTVNPAIGRPAISDDQKLDLKFRIAIMDQMEDMIKGTPANPNAVPPRAAQPPLARITIDPETGAVSAGTFDLTNPQHLKEFAAIAHTSSQNPPPLRYFKDQSGELCFQKWDWAKNEALGEKVTIKEMTSGTKESAQAAFTKAGLGSDSEIYKLLQPLAAKSEHNDYNPINIDDLVNRSKTTTVNRNNLTNNSNRLSFA